MTEGIFRIAAVLAGGATFVADAVCIAVIVIVTADEVLRKKSLDRYEFGTLAFCAAVLAVHAFAGFALVRYALRGV